MEETESSQQDTDDAESVEETDDTTDIDELPAKVSISADELIDATVTYEDDEATVEIHSKATLSRWKVALGFIAIYTFILGIIAVMFSGTAEGGLVYGILGGITVTLINELLDLRKYLRRIFKP